MTAEKTYQPTTVRQQAAGGAFFQKTEEPGFFGTRESASFFSSAHIQPKLSVSQPDDPQEKEADAMADHVMRMDDPVAASAEISQQDEGALMRLPDAAEAPILAPNDDKHKLQRMDDEDSADATIQPLLMRKCADCEQEGHAYAKPMRSGEALSENDSPAAGMAAFGLAGNHILPKSHSPPFGGFIQRSGRAPPASAPGFETALQSTKGGGMPLPAATRASMESRFGADFSGVRIHTGTQAESLSQNICAHAFAHGGDIYFNTGKFSPGTSAGSHLLAHELTHTIQQGASPTSKNITPRSSLSRQPSSFPTLQLSNAPTLQRAASERPVPSQLHNAVAKAKGEAGKVNANKEGPDGQRTGWERLVEYFKTTLGEDKVVPSGGSAIQGAVAEQDIKKKREITGALAPAHPSIERNGPYVRDAMPSWCGIFVFWALHKAGVPMKPWGLGGRNVTPDAAYPPSHVPQAGDIAYRQNYSHFAIVENASGNTVTTINGNTAGEDNLGGQVQTRDHPRSDWTAFFDPLMLKDGPLSSGETDAENVRPLSFEELRKKLFHVDAKQEKGSEAKAATPSQNFIQTKPALSQWGVNATGALQRHAAPAGEQELQRADVKDEGSEGPSLSFIQREKVHDVPVDDDGSSSKNSEAPDRVDSPDAPQPNLVQRNILGDAWDAASDAVGDAYDAAGDAVSGAIDWAEDQLNEAKEYILQEIRDYVSDVPGYRLLTVILQRDPVTGARVTRNGDTMLDAGLSAIPVIGDGIRTLLHQTGTWDEAAAFVEGRVADFLALVSNIGDRVAAFIDGLGISDIRHPVQVLEDFYNLIRGIIEDVVHFVCRSAEAFVEMVKRVMIAQVAGFVQHRIPRLYPFLRVAFGYDPITNQEVPRNGTNILNALFAVTAEGEEQKRQLLETGAFQRVAAWIDQGIYVFTNLYTAIRTGFSLIWDLISVDSLLHPFEAFQQIYDHFAQPVADVWLWIRDTALFIIHAIKDALLGRLSHWAQGQRGYFLITLLIGRDPFTNARVAFSVENVIHAFMSLMDGGDEQFQQMKQTGAIDRATNRIYAAVQRLGFTVEYIVGLFTGFWSGLHLSDLANPLALFRRAYNTFAQPVRRLVAFVVEIIKIVVEVVLQVMQFPVDLVSNIMARAMEAWDRIKRDPIGFLKNLLRAIKQGFVQFFDHIIDHLLFGLTGWLMAELRDAGVPELSDFSLRGVITWVLQVLGISMEAIWQKLAAHPRIGPERVARIRGLIGRLEGIWTFIRDVQERGVAAIWERIQEQLSNLWNTILDAVKNWVMEQIVNNVMARLLSMLDPTGIMAVVNSAIALYRAIQSFVRYLRQMLEVVNSFVEGLADIAAGNVATAANFLEGTMRRAMPVVIGFLANQAGLSGIGRRVGEMIGRARQMVDDALTWLVNRAVDMGYAVFERLLGGAGGSSDAVSGVKQELHAEERPYLSNGAIRHEEAMLVAQSVARRNSTRVSAINVTDGGSRWNYDIIQREAEDGPPKEEGSTCYDPGTAPSGIGNIARHGSQGSSLRSGERLYWLESEHVLPFATGRSIWQALSLFLPERGWPEDTQQTTIMIYYGAARIKTPVDNQVSAAINAATSNVAEDLNRQRAAREERQRGVGGREAEDGPETSVAREILRSILTPVQQAKEQAVARTNAAIVQEHAQIEEGCTKTNGQRRGEANPAPRPDDVERAASQQYEDVLGLVTGELLAAEARRQRLAARGLI